MAKNKWKLLLIAAIMAGGMYLFVFPEARGKPWFSRIHLGLDLQGGVHLILQVVTNDALNQELHQVAERVATELKTRNIEFQSSKKAAGLAVEVSGVPIEKDREARQYLDTAYDREYTIRTAVVDGKNTYTLGLMGAAARRLRETTVQQALETVRRRVDALGVSEPTLQVYGGSGSDVQDQIIVELPAIDDPDRVKDLMKNTAQLELRLVKKENGGPFPSVEGAVSASGGKIGDEWEILPYREDRGEQGIQLEYLVVSKTPTITGRHLKNARRSTDSNGAPAVGFFLNSEGAELFGAATAAHVGDRLAIVLDRIISSAPTINERIGADGIIHGRFTVQQAEDLSLVLRSGALPASLRILEDRTVGASLGNDSIRKGIMASLVGFALVIAGMLLYYKGSGVNAIVCLLANLIILLGFMGWVGATLTLPGIAGVILTIGMAVDANILIFERIREELRAGKTVRAAVDAGFTKVFWTIFDTNTTTLIAAAFLFQFGTGPIRGFAITLSVGLVANVFTAIFVSRRMFELVLGDRKVEALSI